MTFSKVIILALFLGLLIGTIGAYSLGYLAAVAVPKSYFEYFSELSTGHLILNIIQQFIGIGILGICAGIILGKVSPSNWILTSVVCYFGVQLYFFTRNGNQIFELPWWSLVSLMTLPLCIFIANYIMAHSKIGITSS